MPIRLEYTVGAELPDTHITWRDSSGNLIDFLTGHTFQLRINTTPTTTIKSTGITGAATDPNITIQFTTGELAAIAPAQYIAQLWANRTADNRDRVL
ncbi:MAG: hypothetical protein ACREF4_13920, partial [Gammaproteobacteria bacterium]